MFAVPSDPPTTPATPDRRSQRSAHFPSTTPAAPPPSALSLPSFTPKGPPPSSTYGSSQFGTGGRSLFSGRNGSNLAHTGQAVNSSPPQAIVIEDDVSSDDDVQDEEPMQEEDAMMVDDNMGRQASPGFDLLGSINGNARYESPRGNKRSRGGDILRQTAQRPRRIEGLDVAGYSKGAIASSARPRLNDPDALILDNERIVESMVIKIKERAEQEEIMEAASELSQAWQKYGAMEKEDIEAQTIVPQDNVTKANMLGSLLLLLHHPQSANGQSIPLPKMILDWLDRFHDPAAEAVGEVFEEMGGYFAAAGFWDAVFLSLNRGRFGTVIRLLEGARFESASDEHFTNQQLDGIEFAVSQAIELLEQCPAITTQDWDIKGPDWTLFRHRVEKTKQRLSDYGEAESGNASLWGSHLGQSLSVSQTSRRVDSTIPFVIYDPLLEMYKQILGRREDITKSCFSWVETALCCGVWWDGNEAEIGRGSLAASRHSVTRYQRTREVDINPLQAYRNYIAASLVDALNEDQELKDGFDVTNVTELGIGCILLGEAELAMGILLGCSVPIASAVAELASAGNWIAGSGARGTIENFDQSDLMVLSYGNNGPKSSKKDELLETYAELLAKKGVIQNQDASVVMDGWELALRILGRLDDIDLAQEKVSSLLEGIRFTTNDQVDSVLILCNYLGFGQHAMAITENYADTLSDSTHRYGDALLYYARAHIFIKAKKVIDVLITSCLVQSTAYPLAKDLDDRMKAFIASPKHTLSSLATIDPEAAQRLASWLSGYAALRKFYDLRDETASGEDDLARKQIAAEALLAIVVSANDPIRGGLFDPSTEVVVPVDGLLVLLGEALPLLRASPSVFKVPQLFTLLKAVEDLQTIGPRIYGQCEALFQTALENAYGADVPSPRSMLRKETSGMTASSQFSLVGSSLLNSQENGLARSGGDSGVLVGSANVRRGWDWRKGLARTARGENVLRIVRLMLAEKVADAWAEGEGAY